MWFFHPSENRTFIYIIAVHSFLIHPKFYFIHPKRNISSILLQSIPKSSIRNCDIRSSKIQQFIHTNFIHRTKIISLRRTEIHPSVTHHPRKFPCVRTYSNVNSLCVSHFPVFKKFPCDVCWITGKTGHFPHRKRQISSLWRSMWRTRWNTNSMLMQCVLNGSKCSAG